MESVQMWACNGSHFLWEGELRPICIFDRTSLKVIKAIYLTTPPEWHLWCGGRRGSANNPFPWHLSLHHQWSHPHSTMAAHLCHIESCCLLRILPYHITTFHRQFCPTTDPSLDVFLDIIFIHEDNQHHDVTALLPGPPRLEANLPAIRERLRQRLLNASLQESKGWWRSNSPSSPVTWIFINLSAT